jgi:hypothetical protein
MTDNAWPQLPQGQWADTMETVKLFTQVVGKLRLAKTPWINHSWHVTLYVSARGLTTSVIPCGRHALEVEFDFIDHDLLLRTSAGERRSITLTGQSVASFYSAVMAAVAELGVPMTIDRLPNEIPSPIAFDADTAPRIYDPAAAHAFWLALVQAHRVFTLFRTGFIGKCSPVHFFWGGADLAVTRFSGRAAPLHPGGIPHLSDAVTREAYSHEVSSAGFWPGDATTPPAFYAYAYPAPTGFTEAAVRPSEARYDQALGEFLLPYAAVRASPDPDAALLAFMQTTYEAAADLAGWDRAALDVPTGEPGRPRDIGRA